MVSEKLKLGSEFQINHKDKTDTFDVLKHFTGIDLDQDRGSSVRPNQNIDRDEWFVNPFQSERNFFNFSNEITKIFNFHTPHILASSPIL